MPVSVTSVRSGFPQRAEALVDGAPVWIEADADLELSMDAVVSAFLIPSLRRGSPLALDGPLSEKLRIHLPSIATLVREWWGWSGGLPLEPIGIQTPGG